MSRPEATLLILGPQHSVIYDAADEALVRGFVWRAHRRHRSWYAGSRLTKNGKSHIFWMHRVIAATPFGQVCHHRNRDSLDNRRANLLNMPCRQHQLLHQNNSLQIKTDGSFVEIC